MPRRFPDLHAAQTRHAGKPVAALDRAAVQGPGMDRLVGELNALRRRAKIQIAAMENILAELDRLREEIEQHQRSLDR